MSHFEVSEESAADRTLVRQLDLSGPLLSGRRPLFSPIQTNLSSVLEILFALCQSQIFNVRPAKSKKQIFRVGVNRGKIWQMNPNYYLM